MATSTSQITTAEQLLRTPDLGRCELLRGELSGQEVVPGFCLPVGEIFPTLS